MASRYSLQHPHLHLRRGPSVHHSPQPRRLGRDGDVLLRKLEDHTIINNNIILIIISTKFFFQTTLLFFLSSFLPHKSSTHIFTSTHSISIAIEQQQHQELQRIWINLTNFIINFSACLFYIFSSSFFLNSVQQHSFVHPTFFLSTPFCLLISNVRFLIIIIIT